MKVVDFLLDTLALCGVERLFGNPGLVHTEPILHGPVDSEAELAQALAPGDEAPRTLIDVRLDPSLKPVTAARHF